MDTSPTGAPAPDAPVVPGTTVAGFTVQRVLRPSDGRWTVAEATSPSGARTVLHVSSTAAARNAGQRERVARLQRLHAAEDAPLVPLAAVGRDADVLYVARTCPDGTTLADRLADGPLPAEEAVRLLSEVAGGLETLRGFGVPFDHVTPGRILLTARRPVHALVTDYGFGPPVGPACAQPRLVADVDYLAPEAARGDVRGTSSVYALACVLFECLTGAPPYPYDRPLLVLEAHVAGPPPRISERADVPRELDRVLKTALSPRPEQRQATPATLLCATQRAMGRRRMPIPVVVDQPAPAAAVAEAAAPARSAPTVPHRAAAVEGHGRRHWPVPAGAGVGALLLVAGTAGFATASLRTSTNPPASTAPMRSAAAAPADARAAYLRAAGGALQRLDRRRVSGRRDLRAARRAGAQSAAALVLARSYRDARRALPARPSAIGRGADLEPPLAATERGYRSMARAARNQDAPGFRAATDAVTAGERSVTDTLTRLNGTVPDAG
jgi:hypothetical protein